ncbi:hypothetical protein L0128_18275 [candidate division KSB1 bacterium]|nr:hypothetical protein [candidate division KSB1 bacterium]
MDHRSTTESKQSFFGKSFPKLEFGKEVESKQSFFGKSFPKLEFGKEVDGYQGL